MSDTLSTFVTVTNMLVESGDLDNFRRLTTSVGIPEETVTGLIEAAPFEDALSMRSVFGNEDAQRRAADSVVFVLNIPPEGIQLTPEFLRNVISSRSVSSIPLPRRDDDPTTPQIVPADSLEGADRSFTAALDHPRLFGDLELFPPIEGEAEPPREPLLTDIKPLRPLIFIPGFLGSRLTAGITGGADRPVWPPFSASGRSGSLELLASRKELKAAGLLPGVYEELIDFLKGIGYVENKTLFLFPYRWVQSNRQSAADLVAFYNNFVVLSARQQNVDPSKVDLLAHSNGGLVARWAMEKLNFMRNVGQTIFVATPHNGAVKAYLALKEDIPLSLGSFLQELLLDGAFRYFVRDANNKKSLKGTLTGVVRKLPSAYELLPNTRYLQNTRMVFIRNKNGLKSIVGTQDTYFNNEFSRFTGYQAALAESGLGFSDQLAAQVPGRHVTIYSSTEPTVLNVTYDNERSTASPLTGWEKVEPKRLGDGTVPRTSVVGTGNTRLLAGGGEHTAIANAEETFRIIKNRLRVF